MISADKAMIGTAELAAELGKDPATICRWAKTKLRAAKWSRGVFLVQKLRDMGVLPRAEQAGAA